MVSSLSVLTALGNLHALFEETTSTSRMPVRCYGQKKSDESNNCSYLEVYIQHDVYSLILPPFLYIRCICFL